MGWEGSGNPGRALEGGVWLSSAHRGGAERSERSGTTERPRGEARDLGEFNPCLGSRIPIFGKLDFLGPNVWKIIRLGSFLASVHIVTPRAEAHAGWLQSVLRKSPAR